MFQYVRGVQERTILVDETPVRLSEAGGGPTLLMIHGWGASRRYWHGTIEALSARARCVAPDLIGCGDSGRPAQAYTVDALADFVARLIETLEAGPVLLMGHSMGGLLCAQMAALRPALVSRLVLANAPVRGEDALYPKSRLMMWPVARWIAYAMLHWEATRAWMTRDYTHATPFPRELIGEAARCDYRPLIESALSVRDADATELLGRIRAPTLVIGSDRDRMVRPSQADVAHRAIAGSQLHVFEETGHCSMLDRPDAFAARVAEFFGL